MGSEYYEIRRELLQNKYEQKLFERDRVYRDLEVEYQRVCDQLHDVTQKNSLLDEKNAELQHLLERLEHQFDEYREDAHKERQKVLSESAREIQKLQNKCIRIEFRAEQQIDALESSNKDKENTIENQEEALNKARERISLLENELKTKDCQSGQTSASQDTNILQEKLSDQISCNRKLEQENFDLMQKVEMYEAIKVCNEFEKWLHNDLDRRIKESKDLQKELAATKLEYISLKSQLVAWGVHSSSTKNTQDIIKKWKLDVNELASLKRHNKSLSSQLDKLKQEFDRMCDEQSELSKKLKQTEMSRDSLQSICSSLEGQKSLLLKECELLKQEIQGLFVFQKSIMHRTLDDWEKLDKLLNDSGREQYEKVIAGYKHTIEKLTNDYKMLVDQREELDGTPLKKRKLEETISNKNVIQLQNELETQRDTIRQLQEQIDTLGTLRREYLAWKQYLEKNEKTDIVCSSEQLATIQKQIEEIETNDDPDRKLPMAIYNMLSAELAKRTEQLRELSCQKIKG